MTIEGGVPHGTLVLVADHSKALLMRNIGRPFVPELEVLETLEAEPNPPTHVQGTDRPGRAAQGTQRSAVGQTDWHEQAAAEFMSKTADLLRDACRQYGSAPLVVAAPPTALSEMRKALPEPTRQLVVAELNKDFTNLTVAEIALRLSQA